MTSTVLIVVHQEHSTPGRIGELLRARGFDLDRRCPNLGDALPSDLSPYAAAVVFGGPQSANDDHLPGIKAELEWLESRAIPSGCPLLGICLGAQEIARVLGAKVGPHDDGLVEIGYWPVSPTPDGHDFLERQTMFYQWHSETFEIPPDAVHLAENGAFPGQAFRYNRHVYGIEFHPEVTCEMIDRWCTSEKSAWKLRLSGAQPYDEQRVHHAAYVEENDRWLGWFLDQRLLAASTRPE